MNTVASFLYNWQTIIASLIALSAAYIATKPVSRQADWARNQTVIQSRGLFVTRRNIIIDIRRELEEAFDGIIEDDELYMNFGKTVRKKSVLSSLCMEEIQIEDDINPDWARDKHVFAESTLNNLTFMSLKYSYIGELTDKVLQLQADLEKLRKCLFFIYYGKSIDFEMCKQQPETNLSFINEVNLSFKSAKIDIQNFILEVDKSKKDLDHLLSEEMLKVDASLAVCDASLQNLC